MPGDHRVLGASCAGKVPVGSETGMHWPQTLDGPARWYRRSRLPEHVLGKQAFVLAQHKLLVIVGGLFTVALISQAVLGWVLGVTDAWLPVFVVAALLAVLVSADARLGSSGSEASEDSYDLVVCAIVTVAVVVAVACLYLPMPWGGLAAGAVVVGLLAALRLSQD
jgi:hypothetical protein